MPVGLSGGQIRSRPEVRLDHSSKRTGWTCPRLLWHSVASKVGPALDGDGSWRVAAATTARGCPTLAGL